MNLGLKATIRNAVDEWCCQVDAKRDIAQEVAHHYHKMGLQFDEDAPGGDLLKPAIPANAQNNTQNFFRWNQRSSMENKANFMDTLPAIISAMPKELASKMLNRFLNPLGFTVSAVERRVERFDRDELLAYFGKEHFEATRAVLLLRSAPTDEQIYEAIKEVRESEVAHAPIIHYLENQLSR
ncbi:hypothetical protein ACEI20_001739 [Vibrio cholerae]